MKERAAQMTRTIKPAQKSRVPRKKNRCPGSSITSPRLSHEAEARIKRR